MASPSGVEAVRTAYRAYQDEDRDAIEGVLTDDYVFFAPPSPGIDRTEYFEQCWPNANLIETHEIVRLVEAGDEVVVTYESTKTDGKRFRNTEIHTLAGDKICKTEVYFGWDL